ncbi:MAG: N-formylglutamate amidohydrolase [Azospirillaceae bacterium]|nr:N-formylglutamate amidohydrolase [Azospirillaceae bacterium]
MSFVIEDVLVRNDPIGHALPLVLDSPHSGVSYPVEFEFSCPMMAIRQTESTYLEELYAAAPESGATLLSALFPRSFIDVNHALDDLEPSMIDRAWPEPMRPSEQSSRGAGLIPWLCGPGIPMYDGSLSVHQVAERIDRYYRPYHAQLLLALNRAHLRFGVVWHISCHAMPAPGAIGSEDPPSVDFVLGDHAGTSCDRRFTNYVRMSLQSMGYQVAVDDRHHGHDLVRRYGQPTRGRHSLRIEVNRNLFMNAETLEKNDRFDQLQSDISRLIGGLGGYVQAAAAAAE